MPTAEVLKAAVDGIQETQQETLTMLGDLIARHNELDERVRARDSLFFGRITYIVRCLRTVQNTAILQ